MFPSLLRVLPFAFISGAMVVLALIIKLQESGKQKEINFWWNKYCSGFPHRTPIAVIEEMKYLLQFPQIITLRRFTWPIENCTPLCTPHIPALYGTTSADSIPVITLEWCDFVGSPVAWFYPALSGLSLVYAEWENSGQRGFPPWYDLWGFLTS